MVKPSDEDYPNDTELKKAASEHFRFHSKILRPGEDYREFNDFRCRIQENGKAAFDFTTSLVQLSHEEILAAFESTNIAPGVVIQAMPAIRATLQQSTTDKGDFFKGLTHNPRNGAEGWFKIVDGQARFQVTTDVSSMRGDIIGFAKAVIPEIAKMEAAYKASDLFKANDLVLMALALISGGPVTSNKKDVNFKINMPYQSAAKHVDYLVDQIRATGNMVAKLDLRTELLDRVNFTQLNPVAAQEFSFTVKWPRARLLSTLELQEVNLNKGIESVSSRSPGTRG